MCEDSTGTEEASKVDAKGHNIRKATDAKLFDSREENRESKARRNQRSSASKDKTYQGHNADTFRHAPNSKKGKARSDNQGRAQQGKPQHSKPNQQSARGNNKPSNTPRVGGTLGLKK